jgi:hypothetical protein
MKYTGLVVVVVCLAFGLAYPPVSQGQEELGFKSPVLPDSREAIFVLSVAELRDSIRRYQQFLPLAQGANPCSDCDGLGPKPDEFAVDYESQREEQDALKVELEEMIRNVRDLRAEIQDIVAEAKLRTQAKDEEGKKKQNREAKPEGKLAKEGDEVGGAEKTYYERLIEKRLDPKFKQIRNLQQKMFRKVSEVDDNGYTWVARGKIADNNDFVAFLRGVGGAEGLLQTELVELARSGGADEFKALIRTGADVYHLPGSYSALSFAKLFGYKEIETTLIKNGATVEAPWDPHRGDDREALTRMVKNQTQRVRNFAATLGPGAGQNPQVAYFQKLLDKLVCRTECLAEKSRQIKVAEN